MREILFRGKRVDNGEWITGYYIKAKHHWHSQGIHEDWFVVDVIQNGGWCNVRGKYAIIPETIGQYTGLTDKNGTKIFEGDIVKTDKFSEPNKQYIIKYDSQFGAFIGQDKYNIYFVTFDGDSDQFEIIGNIYDNSELLNN